jgi:hypothetical protein
MDASKIACDLETMVVRFPLVLLLHVGHGVYRVTRHARQDD